MGDASIILKSANIMAELRSKYPRIVELMEYNQSGTIGLLAANGALRGIRVTRVFNVRHRGNHNLKAWEEYNVAINTYIDNLSQQLQPDISRELFNPARKTLADHIHTEYYNMLPYWPYPRCTQKAIIELSLTGSYTSGSYHIVWSCIGPITCTDKRPNFHTFIAHFSGSPELKALVIDYDKLTEINRVICTYGMDRARFEVDRRSGYSLTWQDLE